MSTENEEKSMTTVDPEEVVKAYIDAKDHHDWDKWLSLLDPDYVSIDPFIPEPVKGTEAVSQYFKMLENVDMKTKIISMMSKGDMVAAELEITCFFKKDVEFAGQPILASDQPVKVKFAKFYRVNSKGLLAEEREYDAGSKLETPMEEPVGEKSKVTTNGLTPESIFTTRIPENLKANLDKIARLNAICQFVITGDAGGSWYIDATVTPPVVVAGTNDQAKCIITCPDQVLVDIVSGKRNATTAVMTGKLKITGDMGVASAIQTIIR